MRRARLIDEQQSVKAWEYLAQITRNFLFALLDKVLVIRNWDIGEMAKTCKEVMSDGRGTGVVGDEVADNATFGELLPYSEPRQRW